MKTTWGLLNIILAMMAGKTVAWPGGRAVCQPVAPDQSCEDQPGFQLTLYTRLNPTAAQHIDLSTANMAATDFNASHSTKYVVHGYSMNATDRHIMNLKTAYLQRDAYNFIAVDWKVFAQGPWNCYPTAVHNGRHVAKCLAYHVRQLRDRGIDDVHFIGISLGAQVVSFVADNLKPYLLPRITGLDPALPMYYSRKRRKQLDAGDARFVDVVHTNVFMSSQVTPCGHVDFYMNDATNQPGCGVVKLSSPECSHLRAVEYFTESISSPAGFWGTPCPGYVSFLLGRCPLADPSILMGEDADHKSRGFVHVMTANSTPYALGRWQVFY